MVSLEQPPVRPIHVYTQEHLLDLLWAPGTPHTQQTHKYVSYKPKGRPRCHTHGLGQPHQCSASLDEALKPLCVQGRDPALGLLFVPAGTSINTAFKVTPPGCWPGKSSSRAIQGRRSFGWALPHDFFPHTHVYSCSRWSGIDGKATSDFTALQRQGLAGTTCVSCPHQINEIILKFINPHLWLQVLPSMWRRDCYKPHYKSPFGHLTDEVYSYTDVHYVPQQQLQHTEISPQRLIPQQWAKKIPPKSTFTAKWKYSLQQCPPKSWCSCSLSPPGAWAAVREAGTCGDGYLGKFTYRCCFSLEKG